MTESKVYDIECFELYNVGGQLMNSAGYLAEDIEVCSQEKWMQERFPGYSQRPVLMSSKDNLPECKTWLLSMENSPDISVLFATKEYRNAHKLK